MATACDLNVAYKDYAAIIKSNGLNGFGNVSPAPLPTPAENSEMTKAREEIKALYAHIAELEGKLKKVLDILQG